MAEKPRRKISDDSKPPPENCSIAFRAVGILPTRLHEFSPVLAIFGTTCLVFAGLEVGLHALIPGSALRNDQLPIGARLLILCYSITVSSLFVLSLTGILEFLVWVVHRQLPTWKSLHRIVKLLAQMSISLMFLLYTLSWGTFWQTGNFIDHRAISFVAGNSLQVFHWVDTDIAVAVVVLALAATFVITSWLPRQIKHQHTRVQRPLVLAFGAAVVFCTMATSLGHLYSSTDQRQHTRYAILYSKDRDNRSGPLTYVLTGFLKFLQSESDLQANNDPIRIIQRPVISMEHYLRSANRSTVNRWNVIIVNVESLRADQLRAYGSKRDVMPAIDNLATESTVFLNTYSTSSHTDYAALTPLSSHYPLRSATSYTYPEKPSYPRLLIYDILKHLGYHTAIFSSSNEYWSGMINYLQTGNIDRFLHAASFRGPTYVMQGDAGFAEWTRDTKHAGSIDDRFTVAEAIDWIDSLRGEPFFLALTLQNSHVPYTIPYNFPRRFGPNKLDFTIRFAHFPRDQIEVVKDIYADSLAYVDAQIARLVGYLKERKMWENTVVVITSDHGQAFYEHGFASHASAIFDEVMKVPLVIRVPQLKPMMRDRVAQQVDVPPTLLGLLGLPTHPSFQGIDLFNSAPNPNRSIYMVAQTPLAYQYGIVRSGHKLIYDEREQRYSLYDLISDPGERLDISGSQPNLLQKLANRLHVWRTLQIDYYADKNLHTREYPPILAE